ncbi:uncharacterized protein LOC130139627 isoform X2 [Syzygium oleosum]|uniref:uncharacterized protein LOC130139627 isoform X2 n=1 Tax=Syzygium oleosum TaxID=219896 RepID=UPI0024B9D698|nr:uncharacterized protein LOC130139627 isoform X2 [Syzygium oleosum]
MGNVQRFDFFVARFRLLDDTVRSVSIVEYGAERVAVDGDGGSDMLDCREWGERTLSEVQGSSSCLQSDSCDDSGGVYMSDLTQLFSWTCPSCDGKTKGF